MSHIVIDARIINSTTGRYIERFLTYLQDLDHKNNYTILVPTKDKNYWRPKKSVKNFTVKTADFAQYSLEEQTKFKAFLNSLKPDLVHFCMPQQPLLYKGKKVTTFHDLTLIRTYNSDKNWLIFHAKQLVGRFAFKKSLKDNDHIITAANYTKKELIKYAKISENKITVVYDAADVSKSSSLKALKLPFKNYLIYVGKQSDYKNIKRLGDAHQKLLQKHPDLGLVLVGKLDKLTASNQAYFKSKNYKNIHFTGFVDDNQLSWLYKNAKSYVFPSLMEGFGLPGLEAMEYGLPVVSSNATCLPEIYGDAAEYFNPLDVANMAQKIDDVLSKKTLRQKLIKNGYKQLNKYSWQKTAKETLKIYQKVLKQPVEK